MVASPQIIGTLFFFMRKPTPSLSRFDTARELVRASLYSPAGLDMRMSSNAERQEATLSSVTDAFPTADPSWLMRRAAIAQLINSAYAWEVMAQYWGLDGDEAGKAASEALAVLLGKSAPDM